MHVRSVWNAMGGLLVFQVVSALVEKDTPRVLSIDHPLFFLICTMGLKLTAFLVERAPIVFDNGRGRYWWGPARPGDRNKGTALECMHALQVVSIPTCTRRMSMERCELNLILADGSRTNVLCRGDKAAVQTEAVTIGEFLGVPVWDATQLPPRAA